LNNTQTKVWSTLLSLALATSLTGCGTGGAQQVQAICSEANAAMGTTGDLLLPDPNSDWNVIQGALSDLEDQLLDLSDQASDADDSQLARDLASVSRDAGSLSAVASLIASVGLNDATLDALLDATNTFTHNEALRSPSDRTFIGCN
jgi:hypothetical protein